MKVEFELNGKEQKFDVKPGEVLLDLLRDNGCKSVKRGCETGDCGACMVLVNGRAMTSCTLFAAQVDGKEIRTVEGMEDNLTDQLKQFMLEAGAVQCGFCTPGVLISAYSLLTHNKNPSEEEIKAALDGNLCRCTGYVKQIDAIKETADSIGGSSDGKK
ncbi:MAG: (2Fe-2S)-binding protein [Candidatus Bipolaricaulota bacterium]|nr:(2Fe-2S)-binding protein [Candidatus Bipolaricaulota bacterium]MBS3791844.1 (2Fe-2S)-binding protein [Candidatus Bipolaricaulota bacterium]